MLRSSLRVSRSATVRNFAASSERCSPLLTKSLVTMQADGVRGFRSAVAGPVVVGRSVFPGAFASFARSGAATTRSFGADAGEKEEGEEVHSAEQDAGQVDEEVGGEVEKLRAEVSDKEAQVKDLNDKLLRTLADMENPRRGTKRQAEAAEKFAIQGFCKDLLDVADNLGRATSTVDIDATNDAEKTKPMLMSLHEGVLMVEKQLSSTFSKHGVEKYDPTGDAFDPNDHMALFNVPLAEGKEAGTVAAVTKAGYKLHDRIIRPAEVGVYQ